MVLAGPGSGKTSVIVERTAYMTGEGRIPPENILVVTFSRAAAKEMKERFLKFTGQSATRVTFGTFHGVFYGILRQAYGFTAANILSEEEKSGILKELILNYGGDLAEEGDFPEEIAKEISVVKGNRISLEYYYSSCCPDEVFRQIYSGYCQTCQARRKLDFDDMLLYCYELFVQRKDILAAWQNKFQYILVDEFQDINQLQYDIVRMLAKPQDNLFIVGDDDQSIYHFRGARPEIMLNFTKDYPKAETVTLDVNYRCSGRILSSALRLIGSNKKRFQKNLSTPNQEGCEVTISEYQNPREEYLSVVARLRERMEKGDDLKDTALLLRTNQEAEGLVGALMERQVRRYAAAFGWIDRVCAVRDSQGRLTVELYGEGIDDIMKQGDGFSAGLSALLGVTLTAPEKKKGSQGIHVEMHERAPYRAVVGIGRQQKEGASVSGDNACYFLTDTGTACLLLSDGMGSGAAASRDSRMLITSLERFLRAGISVGDALHAVSPALRLRSDGMRFTTLDAFTLDLFSGRAENLMCGAAPTYMRLNGRWTILPGTALPIGLAEEDELGDAVPLQMNDGDIVVLLSDGVTDGTDDKWVRQLLIAHAGDSPKEIAAQLVNEAKGRGHDDDRTVMVMKIEKLE